MKSNRQSQSAETEGGASRSYVSVAKPLRDHDGNDDVHSVDETAMDRRVNRKLDIALLPLLSLLYLFNGLDRGNVGNAQTQGHEYFTLD